MKHIITGGNGFLGKVLARKLTDQGREVVVFDIQPEPHADLPKSAMFVSGDIRNENDLKRIPIDQDCVVYHLAARQFADAVPARGRDPWFEDVNVGGTSKLVDAMRRAGGSNIVFFSTDMVYGKPLTCPVEPAHPRRPLGPYGRSKCKAEDLLHLASWLRPVVFRPRLIVGPGRLGILGKLFRLIRAGLPVPMVGSGDNRYQMVGVEDCALAAVMAVEAGFPTGPFNLGSASPPTTRELLEAVIQHAKSSSVLIPTPAKLLKPVLAGFDRVGMTLLHAEQFEIADLNVLLDTTATKASIGWEPTSSDLAMMIAAYDAFRGKGAT